MSPVRSIDSMLLFLSGCNGSAACGAGRVLAVSAVSSQGEAFKSSIDPFEVYGCL